MVQTRRLADGRQHIDGYRERRDAERHTVTRTYLDGRSTTVGPDFVTRSQPHRLTETVHRDGRREGFLPDGRRAYHDEFVMRDRERLIRRTVVGAVVAGAVVALTVPLIQTFHLVPVRGVEVVAYEPAIFAPGIYASYFSPLPLPLMVSSRCVMCPPPVVAWATPVDSYADAETLMGDLQIATALQDGMPVETSVEVTQAAAGDPEVRSLASEVEGLRQEVAIASASNPELQAQLDEPRAPAAVPVAKIDVQRVPVPEDARRQVRRQVKDEVVSHQKEKMTTIADVVTSAQAPNHIFQVAEQIEATTTGNETCSLSTGDLIKFNGAPDTGDVAFPMQVVTGKAGSCPAGSVVQVGLSDLQQMLNGFSQRVEQNLRRVHDSTASVGNPLIKG